MAHVTPHDKRAGGRQRLIEKEEDKDMFPDYGMNITGAACCASSSFGLGFYLLLLLKRRDL